MTDTVASGLKDNRRLVTFTIDDPHKFVAYLQTRFDSEVISWLYSCKANDWKYEFLVREKQIRDEMRGQAAWESAWRTG